MTLAAAAGLLACPSCGEALRVNQADEKDVTCGRHHFDVARQGYLNLLGGPEPAHADTSAMVAARVRVHDQGIFAPLADALAAHTKGAARIVEAGAGPATYLRHCLSPDPENSRRGIALDISKAAARVAARADERVAAVVADIWQKLPIRSGVVDAVLCAFAPRNLPEFARILAPGGRLVVATPTPDHLLALRERYGLLTIPADKEDRLQRDASPFFTPIATQRVFYPIDADPLLATDLIAMGPNAFHHPPEITAPIADHVSVVVHAYRKLKPGENA